MLRDSLEVALNDLAVLAEDAASAYEGAAAGLDHQDLAGLLRQLAQERRHLARTLRRQIRQRGDIPRAPDPDYEAVATLWARLKAGLAPSATAELLLHCEQADRALDRRLTETLALPGLPDGLKQPLSEDRHSLRAGLDRLEAVRQGGG